MNDAELRIYEQLNTAYDMFAINQAIIAYLELHIIRFNAFNVSALTINNSQCSNVNSIK